MKIVQQNINEKHLWIGGGILTILILVFAFGRYSKKTAKQKDISDINPNTNPITVSTNSGSITWNPAATIKRIHTAYQNNGSGRCALLYDLLEFQDMQLLALADGYHQMYGKTLRKTLNNAWYACWNLFAADPHYQVLQRLDVLQIP